MEREDLEALAAILRERDILVISDEIYAELTFGGKDHVSIASIEGMQERTVVINGFKGLLHDGLASGICLRSCPHSCAGH